MEDLLYGSRVVDGILKKPEFSFLVKYYSLLYQSLIPNCSLTIKTLRRQHLNVSHRVEQYVLSGDSRRLRCQRLINVLLVYLDNVKDYVQFCHYLNLISVMIDLPYRMIAEFRTHWGHAAPHHPKVIPQKMNKSKATVNTHHTLNDSGSTKFTKDIHSVDHCAPHSVSLVEGVRDEDFKVESVVKDDGASVDKANKSSISDYYQSNSRRRHVVSSQTTTTKQPDKNVDVTSSTDVNTTMGQRSLRMPISLDLEFMLSSSEWSIVDAFFSPLCDCLPQDYQSTIEKLKSFPQFVGVEHQHQLKSLIPSTLTDTSVINEKILTFLVMNLCYDTNSGGIARLCDVMEQLIEFSESTNCVQEIRCAVSNDTVSLPLTTPPSQPTDSLQQVCDSDVVISTLPIPVSSSSSGDHNLVTEVTHPHATEATNTITDEISITNDFTTTSETDTTIPGLQLLISQYQLILNSLPMDYENTLNLLQNYLTDNQICQILNSPNYNAANKVMLDCLIEKFKESVDISELCKKLELIASLSTSKQLSSVVKKLKAATSNSTPEHEQASVTEGLKLPQILTIHEDFVRLKAHYHTILQLMPDDYEQSIGKLQNHFSDEQICAILYSSNHTTANKLILDCLIERMSCKEDQLDLCDWLEKIVETSNEFKIIIQELRSGVEQAQLPDNHDQEQQSGIIADSFGIMYNMAFSDLRLDSDSKVVAVLKTNYNGICSCLPKDSMVTMKRLKQHTPSAIELVEDQLISLPPDHSNAMIVVLLIKHLSHETEVLSFCDLLENIVDDGTPKKFVHTLRSELIEALSAFTEGAAYFDRLIFSHMQMFPNSKVLAILKKHCSKLCQCLPQDYMKTLDRIRRRASVPEGLVQQLTALPSPQQVNHYIIAAMLRPLTNEAGVLGFCDIMESVLEDEQSQAFIEIVRNEICETLSLPTAATATTTVATTINIIKPITMPLPSTVEQSTEPSVTETSSSSETPSNANNEMTQTGTSNSTTTIPHVSSTELVSNNALK